MVDLLPCPFCGEQPYHRNYVDEDWWSHNMVEFLEVGCSECGTNFCLPVHAIDPKEADDPVTRWNTRK